MKDYHTHPQILKQPQLFGDFVEIALKKGVDEICITDHMPLSCSKAKDRIPAGCVAEYCQKAQELKEAYKGKIRIKCGIELDFPPSLTSEIEAVLKEGNFDFVLGSSHLHVLKNPSVFDTCKTRNEYAAAMFENATAAAKSGYFNAIAHPDMHRWIFTKPDRFPLEDDLYCEARHEDAMENMLDAIQKGGLFLEINPHFAMSTENPADLYPTPTLLERALKKGIRCSYGSDAHKSEDVGGMLDYLTAASPYKEALKI
ncbi:MAG: histidinol-phosphatase HisJ family protein, partial [Clostridia bacterium]|nr:histidinol-phosphatase HisJ family protein [Clostridia bacterium]